MPVSILTSVDLPAPFSPTRAVTSPARKVRLTLCKARTPGKLLETPRSDRTGVASAASDDRRDEGIGRIDSRPKLVFSRLPLARGAGALRRSEDLRKLLDV